MQCEKKIIIRRENEYGQVVNEQVPCGRCVFCLQKKRRHWQFRLDQEMKRSSSAYFVTLTYNDKEIPNSVLGKTSLHKADIVKFNKRLRAEIHRDLKRQEKKLKTTLAEPKIKYFLIGEYGPETKRPHYHAVYFNVPPPVMNKLPKLWKLGIVQVDVLNHQRIGYVTKYMICQEHEYNGKEQPFQLSSNHIGLDYLTRNRKNISENLRNYVIDDNGKKIDMPKYYKDLLYDKEQKLIIRSENAHQIQIRKINRLDNDIKNGEHPFDLELRRIELAKNKIIANANKNRSL